MSESQNWEVGVGLPATGCSGGGDANLSVSLLSQLLIMCLTSNESFNLQFSVTNVSLLPTVCKASTQIRIVAKYTL